MSTLAILCITKGERVAIPFLRGMEALARLLESDLLIYVDGDEGYERLAGDERLMPYIYPGGDANSRGHLEGVHDAAVTMLPKAEYILRLDDDERCSQAMVEWLYDREYESYDHWSFPRAHLWRDDKSYIQESWLWPDPQTRLSIRALAGGRSQIHCGSPYGYGKLAPCMIEHHKFLVKDLAERRAIALNYEAIQPGAGSGVMRVFNTPEEVLPILTLRALGDGAIDAELVTL